MPASARHSLGDIVPPNGGKGKPFVAQGGSPALFHFSLFTLHLPPLGLPFSNFSGGNQRPSRGRSAGVHFEWPKWTKSHLGRSPLRTSLGVRGCPCVLLVSALGPVGSHRWHGNSTERACFSGTLYFDCQGLTLVCNCSQLPEARLPVTA